MNQCPHCGAACGDSDMICRNCGGLLNYRDPAQESDRAYRKDPAGFSASDERYRTPEPPRCDPPPLSGLAVASMVLGILGIFSACCFAVGGILSILALVLGCVALDAQNRGLAGGKGLSISGIATGIVGILLAGTVLILMFAVPAFTQSVERNAGFRYGDGQSIHTAYTASDKLDIENLRLTPEQH